MARSEKKKMGDLQNVCNIIVTLPSDRTNTKTMATAAKHIRDSNVVPAGYSYTVILIVDSRCRDQTVCACRDIETIRVMSSR